MKIKREQLEQGKRLLRLFFAFILFCFAALLAVTYFMDEAEKEALFDESLEHEFIIPNH